MRALVAGAASFIGYAVAALPLGRPEQRLGAPRIFQSGIAQN